MASKDRDREPINPFEREIPVFTVLKNNCILKNIFLVDNPTSLSSSSCGEVSENRDASEIEEILIFGRHPDCNIKLEHPSISRFHLQITSKPSSRSLFVSDLSSVHGTWVSGKKIEAGVKVKLNEGDTLSLGSSSRLYQLNWVPYSRAYDVDDPFVPQLDTTADSVEQEMEVALDQDEKFQSLEDDHEAQNLSENLEGLEQLFSGENEGSFSMEKTSPFEDLDDPFCKNEATDNKNSFEMTNQAIEILSINPCEFEDENSPSIVTFPSPECQKLSQEEIKETSDMTSSKKISDQSIWLRRGKSESVQVETSRSRRKNTSVNMPVQVDEVIHENDISELILKSNFTSPGQNEEIYTPDKENHLPDSLLVRSLNKGKSKEASKRRSISGTPFSSVDHDDDEIFTPDKENMNPESRALRFKKNSGLLEEAKSSPLKRVGNNNMHPQESIIRSLVKECKNQNVLQERKSMSFILKSRGSMRKQATVQKAKADREPFCPLTLNSVSKDSADSKPSIHEVDIRSSKFTYPSYEEEIYSHVNFQKNSTEKRKWTITVDTGCLLNAQSRKALQLLRGLKGTKLVIPRIVVRELDCMLRCGRSFFRTTSEASSALQWIEDCMANANWWIHVQSAAEENRVIPPTPPASSPQWFKGDSRPFSPFSLREIVTPTPEDHILECALMFKRAKNDGQLVLLSDDVTLKIKAMAEGVICETAQEFRGSLVNPFSDRFLYTDSSPRGPTWSCEDDTVLKETYYPSPSKKLIKSGEGVKGLKLILKHNSNFGQIARV